MITDRKTSVWLKILMICWMVWVFLDYWFKHVLYAESFKNVLVAIPVMQVMIGVAFCLIVNKFAKNRLNWIGLILLFLAFVWSGTLINLMMYSTVEYTFSSVLQYLGRTTLYIGLIAGIVMSALQVGHVFMSKILLPNNETASSIHVALGLSFMMILTFIILALGVFSPIIIAIVLFAPLLIMPFATLNNLKAIYKPIPAFSELSVIGLVCVVLIVLMNAITFSHTLSPFPVGFDAQNYYINLPKLMADAGELQRGFQPYNWSLLQAAVYGMIGKVEMLLIMSWFGLILVQWSTLEMGKKIMNLSTEIALVGVLLFSYMPSVTTQASQELKVDLGLTFMLLSMVIATFTLSRNLREKPTRQSMVALATVIGILGGIALGIKLTAIIAIFAVVAILWYQGLGRMAFLGVFFVCLSLVFFVQLDTRAGLRHYHDSVGWLQIVLLFLGVGCLFYAVKDQLRKGLKLMYLSAVIVMIAGMVFAPWMLKNYSEIKNPSFIQLLNGANHGPKLDMKLLDRNLKKRNK